MKYIVILISILFYTNNCLSQKSVFKPFSMAIITPDTAIIDSSLIAYIDIVYKNHLESYYYSIEQINQMLSFSDYPEDMKKQFEETKAQTKKDLENLLNREPDVKNFKFYQTISEYSNSIYQFYFNEYPPLSSFQTIKTCHIDLKNLKLLSDSLNVDYIVGYKNIYTMKVNGRFNLKLTTVLYSKKEDSILLEKETTGDTNSYGEMWTCDNPLQCLLINGVKTSTNSVSEILVKRQLK